MSSVADVIDGYAEAFNAEREELANEGTSAYLLVRVGQNNDTFRSLKQVEVNWLVKFSQFRGQINLQIADTSSDIVTAIVKCSDMALDGYVYEVDKRDKQPPDGERPWWDLFGTMTGETFTPGP